MKIKSIIVGQNYNPKTSFKIFVGCHSSGFRISYTIRSTEREVEDQSFGLYEANENNANEEFSKHVQLMIK